ncbi:ABC transporter permease [Bradyrhizobium cajani]|uniref:ABC transporter permease subunit n=1 Tax=Bradyrhizobium cajani TaxID=1928661 RepID=A0A844TBF4_9BRAD|nr:ABC transporter permease [Bradyrhizobium cajani]MCP3371782.1 ABC transporter permease [Bradyrhizobium cajani]MVT76397.1 ABC transporter permease subunit [Bradyrhizobium cajani]
MNTAVVRLIAGRIVIAILTLLFVSLAVFVGTEILPGDVAQAVLGQNATPEAVAGLRHALHLDQPAYIRYFLWLGSLLSGDPGRSLVNGLPVATLIASRLPNSLMLAFVTAVICVPIALMLGILSAVWRGSRFDRAVSFVTMSIISVPEFMIATLLVIVFAVNLRWFPALSYAAGKVSLDQFFRLFALPVLTLTCVMIAQMMRMTRAAVIDTLRSSYVEMAVLKGASPIRVVLTHALPNAIGPIANIVALNLSFLLGGAIIVEVIFNYPGLARLLVDAVSTRDMPLVQACVMIFCATYLFLVMLADISGILSNPRLRHR